MARQDVVVEFFYSGAWHSVPVYAREPITITRGKQDEGGGPTPQTATFTLDNRDGRWSTFNPSSPLYGLVGQNTPVRITLTDFRFWGEVASMRPGHSLDYDPTTGRGDAWVEVEAAGPLRRINAGTDPLGSPVRRAILAVEPTDYWPLEETADATEATNLVPGRPPLRPRSYSRFTDATGAPIPPAGLPKWATGNDIPGSLPVPDFAEGGGLSAELVPPAGANSWRIAFVIVLPRDQADNGGVVIRWDTTVSTWSRWEMQFDTSGLFLTAQEPASGTAGYSASWPGFAFDGQPHTVEVEAFTTSGNLDVRVYVDDWQVDQLGTVNAPNLAGTVGGITRVDLNPGDIQANDPLVDGLPQLGHLAIWQPPAGLTVTTAAMRGHAGETTLDRFTRLCGEQGTTAYYAGPDPDDVQTIGVQRAAPFADLLAEIERTEGGIIYETRGGVGLVFVTGRGLAGAPPAVTLDYAAGHLSAGSRPVLDDQGVRNDVTAKSTTTNASARRQVDDGPYSVNPPPDGVGRYETTVEVNPASVNRLADYAGRALAAGTVPGLRWPRLVVDVATNTDVRDGVCGLDPGSHVRVVNLPAHVTPDAVDLVVIGSVETIGTHTRTIELVCRPYATVDAPVVGVARADSTTSTTLDPYSATLTAIGVKRPAGSAKWTTNPAAVPFDVRFDVDGGTGGERVRVTAIVDIGPLAQAFTVVRGINGVRRSWPAGTRVSLWESPRVGL